MISVVVAVKNQIEYIDQCFNSLAAQNYSDYEVIFADGKSTDGTREFLDKQIQNKQNFILLDNSLEDAASGRNMGIHKAKGEIIAFIDADAFADPDWLKNISGRFNCLESKNIAGVGGPNLLPKMQPLVSQAIANVMSSPLASGGSLNPSVQHTNLKNEKIVGHIPTCNLAMKKYILLKESGFDRKFVPSEDFELSTRLRKKGFNFFYDPLIKVYHYRRKKISRFAKQIFEWGVTKTMISKKHKANISCLLPIFITLVSFIVIFLSFYFIFLTNIIFIVLLLYLLLIIIESLRISFKNIKNFPYSMLLLPLIHTFYVLGAIKGAFKKI